MTGTAPPCIAGTRDDAEELRDVDETAVPLVVTSPEFLRWEVLGNIEAAQECLIEASKQHGFDLSGPVQRAASYIMHAKLSIERGWVRPAVEP
jgi:hypothetical protein